MDWPSVALQMQVDEALGRENRSVLYTGDSPEHNNPACISQASPPFAGSEEEGQGASSCESLHHGSAKKQ